MDLAPLAESVTGFLGPFLPYLLKVGEKAGEEAAKRLGGEAWDKAKALWAKLRLKVETKPAAQEAAQDVANAPSDVDAQTALRLQLKKLLAEDEALAQEIAQLVDEGRRAGVIAIASGERSVAIGGNVTGSSIFIGEWQQRERERQDQAEPLEFELISPTKLGTTTSPERDGVNLGLFAQIRVTNKSERNCSIVALRICEEGGADWGEVHKFYFPDSEAQLLPLNVPPDTALDFCVRHHSPTTFKSKPYKAGRLKLEAQDHRKRQYQLWLTEGETEIL